MAFWVALIRVGSARCNPTKMTELHTISDRSTYELSESCETDETANATATETEGSR